MGEAVVRLRETRSAIRYRCSSGRPDEQVEIVPRITYSRRSTRREHDDACSTVDHGTPAWLHPAPIGIGTGAHDQPLFPVEHEHIRHEVDERWGLGARGFAPLPTRSHGAGRSNPAQPLRGLGAVFCYCPLGSRGNAGLLPIECGWERVLPNPGELVTPARFALVRLDFNCPNEPSKLPDGSRVT